MATSKIAKKVTLTTKVTSKASSPEAKGRRISVATKVENTVVQANVKVAPVKKAAKVTANVIDIKGKVIESLDLPAEIFAAKVNTKLIAQAVRVYLANQRAGSASTKTRGEVIGSTRKIYKQKGTGRARHGAAKAPIFVHGGIAHGPKPKDFSLSLTKNMRKKALFAALTSKLQGGEIRIVTGFDKVEAKTKIMSGVIRSILGDTKAKKVLLVLDTDGENKNQNIIRAGRNLPGVEYTAADRLNAYEVINSRVIVMAKGAVTRMETHFLRKENA